MAGCIHHLLHAVRTQTEVSGHINHLAGVFLRPAAKGAAVPISVVIILIHIFISFRISV